MVASMTGFVHKAFQSQWGSLTCELRAVNHRFLDIYFKIPEELRALEPKLRQIIKENLSRGKVECFIRCQLDPSVSSSVSINEEIVQALGDAANQIATLLSVEGDFSVSDAMRWPGVVEGADVDWVPIHEAVEVVFEEAVAGLIHARMTEGIAISEMLRDRIHAIRHIVVEVREAVPTILLAQKQRIRDRLSELSIEADAGRLEQEMVLYAQKVDVDEELDRINTHCDEVDRVLLKGGAIGRRLDFLMQELNREANTLGSKSTDHRITNASVDLKVLIEQMREQVQNVE
ncbi:MAG TPA: YicC family protein [Gammaproteobacteria bacterium]|nr:YicC family protein [Gammaproteobacteria bacterium]